MNIAKVIEITGLTDRTLRRYIQKGLVRPRKEKGTRRRGKGRGPYSWNFSEQDIGRILEIKAENARRMAQRSPELYRQLVEKGFIQDLRS